MTIGIAQYNSTHRDQIIRYFDAFQDYLIEIDPLKRLRRLPGYAEDALADTLRDVAEQQGVFYMAVDGDTVIGFVVAIIELRTAKDLLGVVPTPAGRITELYVDAAHRGKGVATQLLHEAENYLKQRGCEIVKVGVFAPNEAARNLYQKLGYLPRDIDNAKKL